MLVSNSTESQFEPINAFHPSQKPDISEASGDKRLTQTRIRLRIPKEYHQEPILSRLISEHGLTVNFKAALLATKTTEDGWFDLELQGTNPQIQSALIYLNDLDVEIWSNSANPEEETW